MGGKRVGIIGLGNIGSLITKRLEVFGCVIYCNSRKPKDSVPYKLLRATAEASQQSGRLSGVAQRSPRQRQGGVEAFQVASCVLGRAPCSTGFTLARSSATSGLAEGEASGSSAAKQRRRRKCEQGCIESPGAASRATKIWRTIEAIRLVE